MGTDSKPVDRDLWELGLAAMAALTLLLVLTLTGVWRAATWWASVSDMAAVSPLKTALLTVLAPVVAAGTLLAGLRGPEAWRSGRATRIVLYAALVVLAFGGCVVLPGTEAGREVVATWLSV